MLLRERVLELEECIFDVTIHGSDESLLLVIPFEVDTDVPFAFPI